MAGFTDDGGVVDFSPLPLRTLLDLRSPINAGRSPILDSVNVPLAELPERTYELPSSITTVRVADVGPEGADGVDWLGRHGRRAILAPPAPGVDPVPGRLWSPNEFLESVAPKIKAGMALDLGCGAGRESIYLASLGWQVCAVDLLPDAIERAVSFAARYPQVANGIEWRVIDLETAFPELPPLDLATMFYFLDRPSLETAITRLRPGGSLLLETFTEVHRSQFGKPQSPGRVLRTGELETLLTGLKIEHLSEDWRPNGRHTARAWVRV